MLTDALYAATGWAPSWCRDLCAYYQVRPSEALALGTRAKGRRPSLPGSPTCQPVFGKTWEELWEARPRDTEEAVHAFWQEIGAWAAFRQAVRHRRRSWRHVSRVLRDGGALLEYGAGIAPVAWWLARRRDITVTVADVPSEHFRFGVWRLRRRGANVDALEITPGALPLSAAYDVACVLEILEHCPAPLETIRHVTEHLKPGGHLFEDFTPHDDPHAADLPHAQAERPQVYAYLQRRYALMAGHPWDAPDGGGKRTWRKC